jgi:Ras-related protein Rab-1A
MLGVYNMNYHYILKIILVGDTGVGKTSIMLRFADDYFLSHITPTIGLDFKVKTMKVLDKNIKFQLIDTAGRDKFRICIDNQYRTASGIVLVFDLTNRTSFDNLPKWIENINKIAEVMPKIVLIGNKSDLPNHKVKASEILEFCRRYDIIYIPTSSKDNNNIGEPFINLATQIIEKSLESNNDNIKLGLLTNELNTSPKTKFKKFLQIIRKLWCFSR